MRKLAALLAGVLLVLGCGVDVDAITDPDPSSRPVDLTADVLAGTWRNERRDGEIVFAADGTFEARNLPAEEIESFQSLLPPSFDSSRDRIDGHGSWTLDDNRLDGASTSSVTLHLESPLFPARKVALPLDGAWFGESLGLVFYFGDPDLDVTYVYLKSPPPPSPSPS